MLLGALAGGLLAGLLLTRQRAPKPAIYALPAAPPLVRLPVARPTAVTDHIVAVTYDMVPEQGQVPQRRRFPPAALSLAFALALVLLSLFLLNRPRISALLAPQRAFAGRAVSILYATSGVGDLRYAFDGYATHGTGSLEAKKGSIAIPIARSEAGHHVVLKLRMDGILGHDNAVARMYVLALPRIARTPEPLRIDAFHLQKPFVRAGDVIPVHYRTNARQGMLTLSDVHGVVLQRVPLDARGFAKFLAPPGPRERPFIVTLHAQRNGHALEASAGVIVAATSPKPTAPAVAGATFIAPAAVHGGATLRIAVPRKLVNASLILSDQDGQVLVRSVPDANGIARLEVPEVRKSASYTLTLTHAVGQGTETIIRRIAVQP